MLSVSCTTPSTSHDSVRVKKKKKKKNRSFFAHFFDTFRTGAAECVEHGYCGRHLANSQMSLSGPARHHATASRRCVSRPSLGVRSRESIFAREQRKKIAAKKIALNRPHHISMVTRTQMSNACPDRQRALWRGVAAFSAATPIRPTTDFLQDEWLCDANGARCEVTLAGAPHRMLVLDPFVNGQRVHFGTVGVGFRRGSDGKSHWRATFTTGDCDIEAKTEVFSATHTVGRQVDALQRRLLSGVRRRLARRGARHRRGRVAHA
jgi:hypothetical protein